MTDSDKRHNADSGNQALPRKITKKQIHITFLCGVKQNQEIVKLTHNYLKNYKLISIYSGTI